MRTTKNSKPEEPQYQKRYPNLYRSRYYAMLYVFGWSLALSLIWGFSRWLWLMSVRDFEPSGAIPHVVVPLALTITQLLLCRHYIRGIHNSIEWAVWVLLPVFSFFLYYSVGVYVEVRNTFFVDFEASRQLAMLWQAILLFEALSLFLIYQHYYVIGEYEDSAQKTLGPVRKTYKFSRILVLYLVPAIMVLMLLAMKADGIDSKIPDGRLLVKWGSLFFPYVLLEGDWWRLFSYAFQHGSLMHLASNMICYFWCMQSLLKRYNGYQLLGLFLLASFFSGVSVLIFSEGNTVGASGGIFGLMAFWAIDAYDAYKKIDKKAEDAVLSGNNNFTSELDDAQMECKTVAGILAYNVLYSFGGAVSTSGHLGGLVAGVAIWFLFNIWPILTWLVASLSVVLIVLCLYNCRDSLMKTHEDHLKHKLHQKGRSCNASPSSDIEIQSREGRHLMAFY